MTSETTAERITSNSTNGKPGYLLGSSDEETTRLIRQGDAYAVLTRRVFVEAGIAPGMRVLDLGSGAGDVAFVAAELVGKEGEVVGIDRDAAVLVTARDRAAANGMTNVSFVEGDLTSISLDGTFDALVGRYILMYQPEPDAVIRSFLPMLRPGAVVAFHEGDFTSTVGEPTGELLQQAYGWWQETLRQTGIENRMGPKLYATMVRAGLPGPSMLAETLIGGAATSPGPMILAGVIRAVIPLMVRLGVVIEDDVDIDTLEERLRSEAIAGGGTVAMPIMTGAWTRVP